MKFIDKIIRILVTYKYKKEPFMIWCWGIDEVHDINIITAEYGKEHYRFGTKEVRYKAESEELEK